MQRGVDTGVQNTNDDAQISKLSCVNLGYFKDDFVGYFHRRGQRRPPLINRGYYSRFAVLRQLLLDFLETVKKGNPSASNAQVLSLGAGHDTTWFQLQAEGHEVGRYFELDFQEVTTSKAQLIAQTKALRDVLDKASPPTSASCDTGLDVTQGEIVTDAYCLLPGDLRETAAIQARLEAAGFRTDAPTFVLCECVLVYMEASESNALVRWLADYLSTAALVIYEPIQPDDPFGRQMLRNLEVRGCPLKGVHGTPSCQAHVQRLLSCGWERGAALDMDTIYKRHIDPCDRHRAERIELFDELEEWHLIQQHYCVALGIKDPTGVLADFNFRAYQPVRPAIPAGA